MVEAQAAIDAAVLAARSTGFKAWIIAEPDNGLAVTQDTRTARHGRILEIIHPSIDHEKGEIQ